MEWNTIHAWRWGVKFHVNPIAAHHAGIFPKAEFSNFTPPPNVFRSCSINLPKWVKKSIITGDFSHFTPPLPTFRFCHNYG